MMPYIECRRPCTTLSRLLEIELDGIFRSILLLKKKKYAAIKLEPDAGGRLTEVGRGHKATATCGTLSAGRGSTVWRC